MTKNKHKYLLVYGSLRKQEYNYNTFKSLYADDFQYMTTDTISGYDLFSLGPYPAVLPGDGELVVDMIRCSEECYRDIQRMELGAGYKEVTVTFKKVDCILFVYERQGLSQKVESGDWIKFRNG